MRDPLVTIGIPTRNREQFLARALDATLAQTWPNLEVVVSDNASADGTQALCEGRAKIEPRLRYLRQPRDLGFSGNFQACLDAARGTYFMWLADDDVPDPAFVERTVAYLEAHPDVVTCATEYRFVDESGRFLRESDMSHLHPDEPWAKAQREFYRYPEGRSVMALYGMHRTAAVKAVGAPQPHTFRRILSGTETPFLARLALRGRVVFLPERLFTYTEHPHDLASVAHTGSRLKAWEVALLYLTIPAKLTASALAARRVPLAQRARLVATCWGTVLRHTLRRRPAAPGAP